MPVSSLRWCGVNYDCFYVPTNANWSLMAIGYFDRLLKDAVLRSS